MTPFVRVEGVAAPLPITNVDTDKILSAIFLKTTRRTGLGAGLFAELREKSGFVLNRQPWDRASILITLDNFGCGSSREHAPWALLDFGIRCIVAPSFADIFYNNCFKNGMLPVVLPHADVFDLIDLARKPGTATMSVDLPLQEVRAGERVMHFELDAARKRKLLAGIDEISTSLEFEREIAEFEQLRVEREPWLARASVRRLGTGS